MAGWGAAGRRTRTPCQRHAPAELVSPLSSGVQSVLREAGRPALSQGGCTLRLSREAIVIFAMPTMPLQDTHWSLPSQTHRRVTDSPARPDGRFLWDFQRQNQEGPGCGDEEVTPPASALRSLSLPVLCTPWLTAGTM